MVPKRRKKVSESILYMGVGGGRGRGEEPSEFTIGVAPLFGCGGAGHLVGLMLLRNIEVHPQLGRHGEGDAHPRAVHDIRLPSYSAVLLLSLGAGRGNPCVCFRVEGGAGTGNEIPVIDVTGGCLTADNDRVVVIVLAAVDFGNDGGWVGRVALGAYGCKAIGTDFELGAVFFIGGGLIANAADCTYDVGAGFMATVAFGGDGAAGGGEDFSIEIFPDAFLNGRLIHQMESLNGRGKGGGIGCTVGGQGIHFCSVTFFAEELNEVVQGVRFLRDRLRVKWRRRLRSLHCRD